MLLDNRYVEGSSSPIIRRDAGGNTYQQRRLRGGSEHELLKNFPTPGEVQAALQSAGVTNAVVETLQYYWYVTYRVTQ